MQLQHQSSKAAAATRTSCRKAVVLAQRTLVNKRSTALSAAAVAAAPTAPAALQAAQEVVQRHGGWFAPEVTDEPGRLLHHNVPFLTTQVCGR